jgi:hypothetical protein
MRAFRACAAQVEKFFCTNEAFHGIVDPSTSLPFTCELPTLLLIFSFYAVGLMQMCGFGHRRLFFLWRLLLGLAPPPPLVMPNFEHIACNLQLCLHVQSIFYEYHSRV